MSTDCEIVNLAVEILFYFSMPSLSLASYDSDSWKETTEISMKVADSIFVVFESLGFMTPNYGLLDFLRSQEPLLCPSEHFILEYPKETSENHSTPTSTDTVSDDRIRIRLSFPPPPPPEDVTDTADSMIKLDVDVKKKCDEIFRDHPDLSARQKLSVRYVVRVARYLHCENDEQKMQIITLRLRLFYILVHSHIPIESLYQYIGTDSPLLKDLVTLSDISSSSFANIDYIFPSDTSHIDGSGTAGFPRHPSYPVATLSLDCLVGLLESSLYRRKQALKNSGILQELGVMRNSEATGAMSHDLPWYSILLTACTALSSSPEVLPADLNLPAENMSHGRLAEVNRALNISIAEYVQVSIELFTACLAIVDYKICSENSAISAIVGLVQNSLPRLSKALRFTTTLKSDVVKFDSFVNYEHLVAYEIWPVVKALQSLEGALGAHRSRDTTFREANGISMLMSLLDVIAANWTPKLLDINSSCNELLINLFSLMTVLIGDNSQRHRINNAADSGVQLLYQPSFTAICQHILHINEMTKDKGNGENVGKSIEDVMAKDDKYSTDSKDKGVVTDSSSSAVNEQQSTIQDVTVNFNPGLLSGLTELFSSAIDAEPQFLGNFLRQPTTNALILALTIEESSSSPLYGPDSVRDSINPPGTVLLEILHLIQAMCITREGKECVRKSRLIKQVIIAVTHPNMLFPSCEGINIDTLHSIGKQLGQIIRDDSSFAAPILSNLRSSLFQVCQEAQINCRQSSTLTRETPDNRKIDKIMQKIFNICSVVEKLNLNGRNSAATENLRLFFGSGDMFGMLIATYSCTLPSNPRKLFAQITTHHQHSSTRSRLLPQYGDYYAAKALTAVLKIGSGPLSHLLLPALYKAIDRMLAEIKQHRDSLALLVTSSTFHDVGGKDVPTTVNSKSADVKANEKKAQSKSKKKHKRKKKKSISEEMRTETGTIDALDMLGVLDFFPDEYIYSPNYGTHSQKYESCMSSMVKAVVTVEWLSVVFTQSLRTVQQGSGADPSLISAGKHVMLKLFDYYHSSLLEVCRVSSEAWKPQLLNESFSPPSGPFELTLHQDYTDSTVDVCNPRQYFPQEYHLRVLISSGAIIREGTEIDGSRIVLLAPRGATVVAYERRCTSGGVIRYRTAHGWLSEFQRDFRRDPIIEVVNTVSSNNKQSEHEYNCSDNNAALAPSSHQRNIQACTLRTAACNVLSRSQAALRTVLTQLSHSIISEGVESVSLSHRLNQAGHNRSALSVTASLLSSSLSEVICRTFSIPQLANLESQSCASHQSIDFSPNTTQSTQKTTLPPPPPPEGLIASLARPDINSSCACLYLGAIVKFVLLPTIDDKNGRTNTYLLIKLIDQGFLGTFLQCFRFVVNTLHVGVLDAQAKFSLCSQESMSLSPAARCALHALTPFLSFLHKIVNYSALLQAPATSLMEKEQKSMSKRFDYVRCVRGAIISIGHGLLPVFQSYCFASFPVHLQNGWMTIIADLLKSFKDIALSLLSSLNSPKTSPSSTLKHDADSTAMHGSVFRSRDLFRDFNVNIGNVSEGYDGRSSQDIGNERENNDGSEEESDDNSDDDSVSEGSEGDNDNDDELTPDASLVSSMIDMGFNREVVLQAIDNVGSQNADTVVEYLFSQAFLSSTISSGNADGEGADDREDSHNDATRHSHIVNQDNDATLESIPPLPLPSSDSSNLEVEMLGQEDMVTSRQETQFENAGDTAPSLFGDTASHSQFSHVNVFSVLDSDNDPHTTDGSGDNANTDGNVCNESKHIQSKTPRMSDFDCKHQSDRGVADDERNISQNLESLVREFGQHIVPYTKETWEYAAFALNWTSSRGSCLSSEHDCDQENSSFQTRKDLSSASLLGSFVVTMSQMFRSEVSLERLILNAGFCTDFSYEGQNDATKIIQDVTAEHRQTDHSLYGRLLFMLSLLRNSYNRMLIEPFLTSEIAEGIASYVASLLDDFTESVRKKDVASSCQPWVPVSLLICFDLSSSINKSGSSKMSTETVSLDSLRGEVPGNNLSEDEEEEESKDDIGMATALGGESSAQKLSSDVTTNTGSSRTEIDTSPLLTLSTMLQLYEAVYRLLTVAAPRQAPGDRKYLYLDIDTMHSALLLLSSLLSREEIADRFVNSHGLKLLFRLPAPPGFHIMKKSGKSALYGNHEKLDHIFQSLLSLVVRRCLETRSVLKANMKHEIKHVLRHAISSGVNSSGRRKEVTLKSFLYLCADFIMRDANIFLSIIRDMGIMFKKRTVSSSAQGDDNEDEIVVEFCSEPYHRSVNGEEEAFPGSRALVTLSACVEHIVAVTTTPTGSGTDKGSCDPTPVTSLVSDQAVFTVWNCLHALSDAALSLRGLPQILSKFRISSTNDDSNFDHFVPYIVSHIIPSRSAENVVGSSVDKHMDKKLVEGGSRLLASLSSHKGSSMRAVMDSLICALTSLAEADDESGGKYDVKSHLIFLSRIMQLLSNVLTSCRLPRKGHVSQSSHPDTREHISFDAMSYMTSNGIATSLSQVLASIQRYLSAPECENTLQSVIDLLEMLSRPKYLHHLGKMKKEKSHRCNSDLENSPGRDVRQPVDTVDVDVSHDESAPTWISVEGSVENIVVDLNEDVIEEEETHEGDVEDRSEEIGRNDHLDSINTVVNSIPSENSARYNDSNERNVPYHVDEGQDSEEDFHDDDNDHDNDDGHGDGATIREHSLPGIIPCFDFMRGECSLGDDCGFLHSLPSDSYHVDEQDDDEDDEDEDDEDDDDDEDDEDGAGISFHAHALGGEESPDLFRQIIGDRNHNIFTTNAFGGDTRHGGFNFITPPDQIRGDRWGMFHDDGGDGGGGDVRGSESNIAMPWMMNMELDHMEMDDNGYFDDDNDMMMREIDDIPYHMGNNGVVDTGLEFGNTLLEFIRRTAPSRMMQQMHNYQHSGSRNGINSRGALSRGRGQLHEESTATTTEDNDPLLPGGLDLALQVNWLLDHPILQNAQSSDRAGIGSDTGSAPRGGNSGVGRGAPSRLSARHVPERDGAGFGRNRPSSSSRVSLYSSQRESTSMVGSESGHIEDVFDAITARTHSNNLQEYALVSDRSRSDTNATIETSNDGHVESSESCAPSQHSALLNLQSRMRARERGMRFMSAPPDQYDIGNSNDNQGISSHTSSIGPAVIVTTDTQGWLYGVSRRDTNDFYDLVRDISNVIAHDALPIEEVGLGRGVISQTDKGKEVASTSVSENESGRNEINQDVMSDDDVLPRNRSAANEHDIESENRRLEQYFPSASSTSEITAITSAAVVNPRENNSLTDEPTAETRGVQNSQQPIVDAQSLSQMFANFDVNAIIRQNESSSSSLSSLTTPLDIPQPQVVSSPVDGSPTRTASRNAAETVTVPVSLIEEDEEDNDDDDEGEQIEELPTVEYEGMGSDENEVVLQTELIAQMQEQISLSACSSTGSLGNEENEVDISDTVGDNHPFEHEGEHGREESSPLITECEQEEKLDNGEDFNTTEDSRTAEVGTTLLTTSNDNNDQNDTAESNEQHNDVGGGGLVCPPGYDEEVFNSLPDFMQQEVVDSYVESSDDDNQALLEAAGYDMETIAALPDSIRLEIVEQLRQQQAVERASNGQGVLGTSNSNPYGTTSDPSGGPSEIDNVTFLTSLAPELREEVLLTSDPSFISTLTPELIAEAEALHERAAVRWNRHVEPFHQEQMEGIIGGSSDEHVRNRRGGGGNGARSNICAQFILNGSCSEGDSCPFSHDGSGGVGSGGEKIDEINHHAGEMRLEQDDLGDSFVPVETLAAVLNIYYFEKLPVSSRQLNKLMFNLTKQIDMRTAALRLTMALLSNTPLGDVPRGVKDSADESADMISIISSCSSGRGPLPPFRFPPHRLITCSTSRLSPLVTIPDIEEAPSSIDVGGNRSDQLPPLVGKRLIALLSYLSQNNRSFIFEVLKDRGHDRTLLSCLKNDGWGNDDYIDSGVGENENRNGDCDSNHDNAVTLRGHCYLELLIRLLLVPAYTNNTQEMLQLVTLINSLCAPLELVPLEEVVSKTELADENAEKGHAKSGTERLESETAGKDEVETKADTCPNERDDTRSQSPNAEQSKSSEKTTATIPPVKQDPSWVKVPKVILTKPTLRCLCDIFLSELCSREVFDQVVTAIIRLARVPANHTVLINVIVEVSSDLAVVSLSSIENILGQLNAINVEYSKLEFAEMKNNTAFKKVTSGKLQNPTLPVSDVGSQHHIRLMRALQTLQSLTDGNGCDDKEEKTACFRGNAKLVDVAPLEELQQLWLCTDKVLHRLSAYLDKEDLKGQSDINKTRKNSKLHSGLSAMLGKLLPIVESFFLVHASDMFCPQSSSNQKGGCVIGKGSTKSTTGSDGANEVNTDTSNLDSTVDLSSPNSFFQLSRQQSLPGTKYRQSESYSRFNISLSLHHQTNECGNLEDSGSRSLSYRRLSRGRSLLSIGSADSSGSLTGSTSFSSTAGYQQLLSDTSFKHLSRSQRLLAFVHTHRNILNILVQANPELLDGSLAALARITQLRSYLVFENKRAYFYSQLKKRKLPRGAVRSLHLQVS